jgi:hypothetical protein
VPPYNFAYNSHQPLRNAALIFGTEQRMAMLKHIAEPLGCSISDGIALATAATPQLSIPDFDLLLIDYCSNSERAVEYLSNISGYLTASNAEALVWTDLERLEEAYAILPVSQCHFLVGLSDAEAMLIMAGAIRRGKMNQVHEGNREFQFGALHRISDELADFARTLARIAEHDEGSETIGLAERPVSFRPAPALAIHPFIETPLAPAAPISAEFVRDVIKQRRLRDKYFETDLFADPAWDILLDLLAARLENISVSVSSLCIAAAVPATTALRWISGMTESGMVQRRHDPKDARRVFIELSDATASQLTSYFIEVKRRSATVI